jgi:hypothetical protein
MFSSPFQQKKNKKSLLHPHYGDGLVYPLNMKRSNLLLNFAKPAKSPPRAVLDGGFATVTAIMLQ